MRILLIGEFSGFFNSLADGLKILGHEVFLANTGDGLRGFYSDYNWRKNRKGYLRKVFSVLDLWYNKNLLKGFDVVQLICPYIISPLYFNKIFIQFVLKNNSKVFWSACGTGYLIDKYWNENSQIKCGVYDFSKKEALDNNITLNYEKSKYIEYEEWLVENITGIIPVVFEYAQPFRLHPKNLGTIPFPVNIDKIKYKENRVVDKVVFYHGITRPRKGTKYICEAFDIMQNKYKNEAIFKCNNQLPYDQYIELISSANVIVDQTNSFSSGLNGLISMAQGKILLGGAEQESITELGYDSCPIVNITSNINQICESIDFIMDNRDNILKMGAASRMFIDTHHNYIEVAREYIKKWGY